MPEETVYPPLYSVMVREQLPASPMNKRLVQCWKRIRRSPGSIKLVPGGSPPHVWAMYAHHHTGRKIPTVGPGTGAWAVFSEDPRPAYEAQDKWLRWHLGNHVNPPQDAWGDEWAPPTFVKYGVDEMVGDAEMPTLTMIEAIVVRAVRKNTFGLNPTDCPEFVEVTKKVGREAIDPAEVRSAATAWSNRILSTNYEPLVPNELGIPLGPSLRDLTFVAAITTASRSPHIEKYTNRIGAKLSRAATTELYDLLHRASDKLRLMSDRGSTIFRPCPECGRELELPQLPADPTLWSRPCRKRRKNPNYDEARATAWWEQNRVSRAHEPEPPYLNAMVYCQGTPEVRSPTPSMLTPAKCYHWEANVPDGNWLDY